MPANLEVMTYPSGPIETNGYLVIDPETSHALIVDAPTDLGAAVLPEIKRRNLMIDAIVITHGHWDHIGDTVPLKRTLDVPVIAHRLSVPRLEKPGSSMMSLPVTIEPITPDQLIAEGDTVALGDHSFAVWHLPGHEPGHIVLISLADNVMLGGDVLFPNGHGRIDILGANAADMAESLRRLTTLPDTITVYPGHGNPTTIGQERSWLPV